MQLKEFADDKFIGMFDDSSVNNITKFYCNKAGFEPEMAIKSETNTMFREISSLGLGVAFVPQFVYDAISFRLYSKEINWQSSLLEIRKCFLKKNKYPSNAVILLKKIFD